jgi:hypothetical protein
MWVTVGMIVGAMAAGRTLEQLLADFPYVEEAVNRRIGVLSQKRISPRSALASLPAAVCAII